MAECEIYSTYRPFFRKLSTRASRIAVKTQELRRQAMISGERRLVADVHCPELRFVVKK
jgi:hypothetical protein